MRAAPQFHFAEAYIVLCEQLLEGRPHLRFNVLWTRTGRVAFISACLEQFCEDTAPPSVRESFAAGLAEAVDLIARSEKNYWSN
jgi:hypothetical protein